MVGIGGNDFNFADIVQSCVVDFLTSPTWAKDYCRDDGSVTANFTAANVAAVRARIDRAAERRHAMRNAGYADGSGRCSSRPTRARSPAAPAIRYSQSGYTRQITGGCGFWNGDADWANDTALPTINSAVTGAAADSGLSNVQTLDLASAFNGRRLCESTVGLYEEKGIASWTRRAPSTRPSGSTRSAPSDLLRHSPTTSRSRSTRTTGASSPPAAASGRPGTPAPRAAAPAPSPAPAS